MHAGADIMNGRRRTNTALAAPRIARPTSTILRVGRGCADEDALWFMPFSRDGGPLPWRMRFWIRSRYTPPPRATGSRPGCVTPVDPRARRSTSREDGERRVDPYP